MLLLKNNISTTKHSVGFTYDPTNSSPALTASGTPEMVDLGIFYSKIKPVLLQDNLTEYATLATWANPLITQTGLPLDGTLGQVMVRIPKFYYREVLDGAGILIGADISETPKVGYTLHPKFSYGANNNYVYVAAYQAGDDGGTKLKSASGVAVLSSQALSTFRTRAAARGAGWYQYDFWTHHLLQLLTYVYYRTFDIQSVLPGYTEASTYNVSYHRSTGRSNALTTPNGSIDADLAGVDSDLVAAGITTGEKIANRFMWIENIYGHIWTMIDGFAADGRTTSTNKAYVTADPGKFSSNEATVLANYDDLGILLPGDTNENFIKYLGAGLMPKTHGGTESTYVTDYFWSYLDDNTRNYFRLCRVGGHLSLGSSCGGSSRAVLHDLGAAYSFIGSRLCAVK